MQEAQLWRYAAGLTANCLTASDRAISLERWAAHIHQVARAAVASHLQLDLASIAGCALLLLPDTCSWTLH